MKIERQIELELIDAGYKFVRRGKHAIYRNEQFKHTITVPSSTVDKHAVQIIRGLIRRGRRQHKINR